MFRRPLLGAAKAVGLACAGLSAWYWASFAAGMLGGWMAGVGLYRTDAVGVPIHPSLEAGTPAWGVAAVWAVTIVGSLAWALMARWAVARFAASRRRGRWP